MKRKKIFAILICSMALMGALALSVYATAINDNLNLNPEKGAIEATDEQINAHTDYKKVISEQYEANGKVLTDEQLQKLDELYCNKADPTWEKLAYQEGVIIGEVDPNAPRLDLATAKEIISKHNDFDKIMLEFEKIQYPDYVGGSGHTVVIYQLDDSGSEIIIYPIEKSVVYSTGKSDNAEILFDQM